MQTLSPSRFRLKSGILKPGIRSKILAIVLGVTLILTLSIMAYAHTAFRSGLEEQLNEKSISLAQNIAARSAEPVLTNNVFELYDLAYNTKENNRDVLYVIMEDSEKNILVHTFQDYFPQDLQEVEHAFDGNEATVVRKFNTEKGVLRDVAAAIFDETKPEKIVRLGVVDYSVQSALATTTRQILLISTIILLAAGTLVYFISSVTFIKPVNALLESVQAVSRGELERQVEINTGDELSELADNFNSMTCKLAETKRMRDSLLQKTINSQEEERQRVARELHDETGPTLSTLTISLQLLEGAQDQKEYREKIEEFRQLLLHTVEQIRGMVWKLTPTLLMDLGLKAALESFINKFWQEQEWELDLHISGLEDRRLPAEVEITAYRVIQEALTNIYKHAEAGKVEIRVEATDKQLEVAVVDDGVGFEPELFEKKGKSGLGLRSMRERVELVRGKLQVSSSPHEGTTVEFTIPLPEEGGEKNF